MIVYYNFRCVASITTDKAVLAYKIVIKMDNKSPLVPERLYSHGDSSNVNASR